MGNNEFNCRGLTQHHDPYISCFVIVQMHGLIYVQKHYHKVDIPPETLTTYPGSYKYITLKTFT